MKRTEATVGRWRDRVFIDFRGEATLWLDPAEAQAIAAALAKVAEKPTDTGFTIAIHSPDRAP